MNPRIETLSLALASALPISLAGIGHAASVTYDADLGTIGAQDGSGLGWNTTDANLWNGSANVTWPNTTADEIIFGAGSGAAGAVTVGTVNANKITLGTPGSGNYSLTGGTITLGGTTPTIAVNADASITSVIAGTVGLTKTGAGTLTLSGSSAYTGATSISGGSVVFTGGGSTGGGTLALGTASGNKSVLNMNSTGTLTHNGTVNVGGAGASANGAGAINQTAGTVNVMNNAAYVQLGFGGYGSYNISGGTLNFTSASGLRIGDQTGGLGSYVQSGGTVNMTRYFVVAGNQGTAPSGVATITGGTVNGGTAQWFILGNGGTATGTMNVGTAAGGTGTVVSRQANGITFGDSGTPTGILNVNNGTIQFNAGTIRKATGTGILNLNGGTLKANAAGLTLVNNTVTSANVYNGGLKVDTQANDATIAANLLTTTGNGIYPAGGIINMPAAAGTGYIGNPLVSVTTGGTGSGATAIANVLNGQVTGVTLTCPGQNYSAGDTVTFTFTGGGASSTAAPFAYVLTAGDVAANGSGGLTKLGTGKLTLSGTNTFTGPVNLTGPLDSSSLTLNNTTLTINGFVPNATVPPVQALGSFTTGGTVQVVVNGTYTTGQWPLIYYPFGGSIGGAGLAAMQLQTGALPRGVVASLVNNTSSSSVDISITTTPLTWKGNTNANWDINTTTNWTIGAAAQKYLEGDIVLFNDSATGSTSVTLNTTVAPQGVTFDNATKNYTLSGSGSIGGTGTLTKSNSGTLTLLTANTSTGATTVQGGTLQLGNGTVNGSIAGSLANNDTVIFNPAGTSTHAGAIGDGSGTFNKNGSGTQIITSPTNTATGTFKVNGGTLQFGNGTTNGAPGAAYYEVNAGTSLRFEQATATAVPWSGITGSGNIYLNSAQAVNASAAWGSTSLPAEYTGVVRVEKGRLEANSGTTSNTALGGTSKVQILPGAQFLAFASTDPYTTPIEIAGTGWGETGYPCALRLAADRSATWAGPVTLTADSGIMAQRNTNFTVTGAITGAFQCEFYSGDPVAENGNLIVAPTVPGQNTYTSTKINGRPAGSVTAGSDQAFSTGPLVVDNAILKLNGHNLSFASLSGAGGAVGNYHATTPVTLTVGSNNADSSYAGVLRDGAVAPLAFTKTGTGTLTLTAAQSYTGNTTVAQGKLTLATSSLGDASTVSINSGAVLELTSATPDVVGTLILGGTSVGTGTYNASHPTYGAYFAGSGSIVVGGAYDSWASSKGLDGTPGKENGLADDPDKDGIQNLTEFYLDGNPLANDPTILPAATVDATYLTLTFHRRDDAEASVTAQAVQYGTNLTSWTDVAIGAATATGPNGVIVTVAENDAAADLITVQIPRTLATSGKLFGRLQVTK
ncbi:beta strand repeat-containing protein [Luteolibacter soli]|uniref:Autotransporter-associated beta strand repeat-containing protein n=1 Tax=Luteolibacter soli TaxID=3135280 RepID=A0ABU9ASU7_9BACT